MNHGLVLLLLLLPAIAAGGQGAGLTLDDAIATGLAQSRTLHASAARAEAAEARAGEARTARLPVLKGEASYRRLSEVDPFQVSLVPWQFSLQEPDAFVIRSQLTLKGRDPYDARGWSGVE